MRLEDAALYILADIGATQQGKKELAALSDGYRESEASWREMLLDLWSRGLRIDPHLANSDDALGFWNRCYMYTACVLNKLLQSQQPMGKWALHEIWRENCRLTIAHTQYLTISPDSILRAWNCREKIRFDQFHRGVKRQEKTI